ncbi:MAG: hypothetical protein J6Y37_13345 [Paludibacteraceae bacterium]|nr:hypothetical protein [Paludibacteraceae bacterium]
MCYFLFFLIVVGVYLFMGGLYVKRLIMRCRKGVTQYVFDPKDRVAALFAASFYGLLLLLNLFFYKSSNLYDYEDYIDYNFFLRINLDLILFLILLYWDNPEPKRMMLAKGTFPISLVGIIASMFSLYMVLSPLLVSVGAKYVQGPDRLMTFEIVERGYDKRDKNFKFHYFKLKPVEEVDENISLDVSRDSVGDLDYWALAMTDKLCVPYVRLFDTSQLFRVKVSRDEFFDHDSGDRIGVYVFKDFFGQIYRTPYYTHLALDKLS